MSTAMVPMDFGSLAQSYMASTTPPMASAPKPGDSIIETLVGAGEIGGMAVAMGYLNARSPAEDKSYHELFGYPTDVVLGVGGLSLGLIMALFGSKQFGHVVRLGIGCLIEAGVRMGLEKGVNDREGAKIKELQAGKKAELRLVTSSSPASTLTRTPAQQVQQVQGDVFQPVR